MDAAIIIYVSTTTGKDILIIQADCFFSPPSAVFRRDMTGLGPDSVPLINQLRR